MSSVLIAVVALIILLGVLIFVHELGHFIAAKAAGIYVHRFSLGMGAPIKALSTRRGETEYAISWLPIGGYVKMASREEDPASSALEGGAASRAVPPDRVFEAKPVWVRMIVILAGVTMNVLFAWLVFSGLAYLHGVTVYPVTTIASVQKDRLPPGAEELARLAPGDRIVRVAGLPVATWDDIQEALMSTSADSFAVEVEGKPPVMIRIHRDALEARLRAARAVDVRIPPVVDEVTAGGPAERAGVRKGDTLVALAGRAITDWREAVEIIEAHPDQDLTILVGRPEGRVALAVHTLAESVKDSLGKRRVGKLRLGVERLERHRPLALGPALVEGARQTLVSSTQIVRVVRGMLSGRVSTREVGGPIAIGAAAGEAARLGVAVFVGYMGLISVNLAVINLLPIPVLDGGQFLFLLGEAVLRRPLGVKLRERLTMVGLVLIVLLMVLAFSNDIRRLLGLL
ncbi:MAG TPA: RIP metalloprotease RseP [Gemmatimonadales bacterium]|jgi:regulator of sigma E protease|nr:RIP metalloprotease RseP [Gemmatimonadales bacterium]